MTEPALDRKYKVCKKASNILVFATDAVNDYLTEFPDCECKAALMTLSRDMNDLSFYIGKKYIL